MSPFISRTGSSFAVICLIQSSPEIRKDNATSLQSHIERSSWRVCEGFTSCLIYQFSKHNQLLSQNIYVEKKINLQIRLNLKSILRRLIAVREVMGVAKMFIIKPISLKNDKINKIE